MLKFLKVIALILIFFKIGLATAQSHQNEISGFSYRAASGLAVTALPQVSSVIKKWFDSQFVSLALSTDESASRLGIDHLWIDSLGSRQIYFKSGIVISDKNAIAKILHHEKGFLYHIRIHHKRVEALFFRGFKKSEVQNLISSLEKSSIFQAQFFNPPYLKSLFMILNPAAMAAESHCTTQNVSTIEKTHGEIGSITSKVKRMTDTELLHSVIPCVRGAFEGSREAVTGGVKSMVELLRDPGAFWGAVSNSVDNLTRLMSDLQGEARKVIKNFDSLPVEDKAHLVCSFVAGVGVEVMVAVLAPGYQTAILLQRFSKFLQSGNKVADAMKASRRFAGQPDPSLNHEQFTAWLRSHPDEIWSEKITPNVKSALNDFSSSKKIEQGLIYGNSVKTLRIDGLNAKQLDRELVRRGFTKHRSVVHDPVTKKPVLDFQGREIIMDAYTHPDGGMVRVKPNGDVTSKYRPQPHASKSVRYPADASYENFEFEAFKVDDLGMPLPKWSKDIRNPYGNNTPKGAPFLDNWADDTHINLQLAN